MSLRDKRSTLALAGGLAVVEVTKVAAGWGEHPSWFQLALAVLVFGGVSASILVQPSAKVKVALKKTLLPPAMLQIAYRSAD